MKTMTNNTEYSFKTDKLEKFAQGNVREIVGYAMTGDVDSYNSAMTDKAMSSFLEQVRTKKIIVDVEHQSAFLHNIRSALRSIMHKSGVNSDKIKQEVNTILKAFKFGDIPFAKIMDAYLESGKVKLISRTNEAFSHVDKAHQEYYSAVLKSIDTGFIDGYSISFFPKTYALVDGKRMIDELVVTGVALTGGRSNPNTNFVSVMTRCAMDSTDEEVEVRMSQPLTKEEFQKYIKEQDELKSRLAQYEAEREVAKQEKLEADKRAADDALRAKEAAIKTENEQLRKQLDELKRQKDIQDAQSSQPQTYSAQRRGLAPEGKPYTEPTKEDFGKKVHDVLGQLDTTTEKKSAALKRDGRWVTDPQAHKRNLMEAVRLQFAGKTHFQKPNAAFLTRDPNDVVVNKEK
jgi:hypothetical protein